MPIKSKPDNLELAGLRRLAEKHLLRLREDGTVPMLATALPRLTHELQVHQIELQLQNDELVESREAIEAGLKRYTDLYDFSPVSFLTLGPSGGILQSNLATGRLLGAERTVLNGRRLAAYVVEAERQLFNDFLQDVFESQKRRTCEVELDTGNKSPLTVQIEATFSAEKNECLLVMIDITERKKAEAIRLENEQRLLQLTQTRAAILDALPAHIALIDDLGVVLDVNKSWRQFACANQFNAPAFGVGQNYLEICEKIGVDQGTQSKEVADGIRRVLRNEAESFNIEYSCHSSTEKYWFRLVVTPLLGDRQHGAVLMHVDITEMKKAEEVMKQKLLLAANINRVYGRLSPREKQVMACLSEGMISKQIANRLSISAKTIEKHRARVMQKMNADSLADIVRAAVELGI